MTVKNNVRVCVGVIVRDNERSSEVSSVQQLLLHIPDLMKQASALNLAPLIRDFFLNNPGIRSSVRMYCIDAVELQYFKEHVFIFSHLFSVWGKTV